MRNCLRIPRLFLPRDGERFATPPCDVSASLLAEADGAESALPLFVPDYLRGENAGARIRKMRDDMYSALENGTLVRFGHGVLLILRETSHGTRRGILAQIDIEEFGEDGMICPTTVTDPDLVHARARERRGALLELPHTLLCYKDKREKVLRGLKEDELDPVYDCATKWGNVSAKLLPAELEEEVLHGLIRCADPGFGVLDGNHSLAAAKLYWDSLKLNLTASELRDHPARFALAEFVNLYDPAVAFERREGGEVPKAEILSLWKKGKRMPAKSVGPNERDARLVMECREITYD